MLNGKKIIAIITARGGSKGIPKKNIQPVNKKPLIWYSIKAGLESKYIDLVLVSTDDNEIAQVSRDFGAVIPFLRPEELSLDSSSSEVAILHAINWMEVNEKQSFDCFVLLQPTSPLRNSRHVDQAIEMFFTRDDINTLYSMVRVKQNPYKIKSLNNDGLIVNFVREIKEIKRRQDLPVLFYPNGAIYISNIPIFKQLGGFDESKLIPFIMSEEESVDIDAPLDLRIAEFLLKENYYV